MRQLLRYLKPYLPWITVLGFSVLGQSLANLALPGYAARIIDQGIVAGNMGAILNNGLRMLLIALGGGALTVLTGFIAARVSAGYAKRLRDAVFAKVESFSLNEFNVFSSSSLITRATNDIQQIQQILAMLMRMSLLAPFMGVGAIIKADRLASDMSWVMLTAVLILATAIVVLFVVAIPKFNVIQQLVDRLGLEVREMLTGVRVIRAYGKDQDIQEKFEKPNKLSADINIFVSRLVGMMGPLMMLVMGAASVTVVWLGSYMVGDGRLAIGEVMALVQYVSQAIMSFMLFSIIFIMVPRAAVSGRRIREVLGTEAEILDPEEPESLPENGCRVLEFHNVSFGYEGSQEPVLSDISFKAEPGKTVAIIGGTGSGKSTVINLIPRLYDVSTGSITLDDIDIRHLSQAELHHCLAYVPQKALLFSGTISENIAYGRPEIKEEEIEKAAAIAQADEFVRALPDGFSSPVSQAGGNLSGGQKQRIAIARAIAKKAPIFLFDDSFSALDFKTDAAVRQGLGKELAGATIIIVAQRISTIMQADNIIVLEEGEIVGQGKHAELMESCPVYREIAESQLSQDELKANG